MIPLCSPFSSRCSVAIVGVPLPTHGRNRRLLATTCPWRLRLGERAARAVSTAMASDPGK